MCSLTGLMWQSGTIHLPLHRIRAPRWSEVPLPAVLACCRPAIGTKGLQSLCTHRLTWPAVPTPAEMEEFKPRKKERGGYGFQAESWDGVAGERD